MSPLLNVVEGAGIKGLQKKRNPFRLKAMQEMSEMMNDPDAMQKCMEKKRLEFEALPEND